MLPPLSSLERVRFERLASLVTVALAGAALLAACGQSSPQGEGAGGGHGGGPGGPGGAMPAMPVNVRVVALTSVPITVESVGQAEGSKEVEIRARVSGLVERRVFAEGERVKPGALMYQIERAPFEIALQQARANLGQARPNSSRRAARRCASSRWPRSRPSASANTTRPPRPSR